MATETFMTLIEGFNVRFVRKGDEYGRHDCLVHDEDEPLVEFYDSKHVGEFFGERGQFVSRYYCETLLNADLSLGLCLDGGVPAWSVSPMGMRQVLGFIEPLHREARNL